MFFGHKSQQLLHHCNLNDFQIQYRCIHEFVHRIICGDFLGQTNPIDHVQDITETDPLKYTSTAKLEHIF